MKDKLKIAVMGGGNSAQTMAADLALTGFEVNLCELPRFTKNIENVIKSKQIEKYGSLQTSGRTGLARLAKVTTEVGEAVKRVDVIIVAVPAYGHMAFFNALVEYLEDGQIVVIVPGNWGALRFFNLLQRMRIKKNVKVAETDRCIHICRAAESWLGPEKVRVILERDRIQIASIPAKDTGTVVNTVRKLYPQLTPATNILETSLNNSNIVVHGPLVLMNTGWIEHTEGQFMLYRDGATPSIGSVVDAISDERDTIVKKLGFSPIPREPFYEQIMGAGWPHDPCEVGPPSLRHRYLSEDIPYGLVPLAYFGDLLNVPTPISDAMIELSSITNNVNYWKAGLTLEKLRIGGLSPEEILKLVNEGGKQRNKLQREQTEVE